MYFPKYFVEQTLESNLEISLPTLCRKPWGLINSSISPRINVLCTKTLVIFNGFCFCTVALETIYKILTQILLKFYPGHSKSRSSYNSIILLQYKNNATEYIQIEIERERERERERFIFVKLSFENLDLWRIFVFA